VNPSYVRIRLPQDDALRRFAGWQGLSDVGPLIPSNSADAVALACDEQGQWKGQTVVVSPVQDWTLFEDLTGGLAAVDSTSWQAFAGADRLVFAGYNDAIPYGALLIIEGGEIVTNILFDASSPEDSVCIDRRSPELRNIRDWTGVAAFVDDDLLGYSESGLLWVYRAN
jgi:hypothetical protein